jgi:hypothetical protein
MLLISELSPIEISEGGIVKSQRGLETKHEETGSIIVQQWTKSSEHAGITVISDHSHVFVLLVHFYHELDIKSTTME